LLGIGAKTVEDAANHPERKRRLGVWAYLISATKASTSHHNSCYFCLTPPNPQAITHQDPQVFKIVIDGKTEGE